MNPKDISLNHGERICPRCHGEGARHIKVKTGYNVEKRKAFCNKCGGNGKIDWIQHATGEDKPFKSAPGFPGLKGMEIVWGSSNDTQKEEKEFNIEHCDPDELKRVYYKIVENLNR